MRLGRAASVAAALSGRQHRDEVAGSSFPLQLGAFWKALIDSSSPPRVTPGLPAHHRTPLNWKQCTDEASRVKRHDVKNAVPRPARLALAVPMIDIGCCLNRLLCFLLAQRRAGGAYTRGARPTLLRGSRRHRSDPGTINNHT